MPPPDLWPPLEEVRQWAAGKINSDQAPPMATGKYRNLIALIDEILASKADAAAADNSIRSPEQGRHR